MSSINNLSFPDLLDDYLKDFCVQSQLLDLVLNSDVETKLSSNFNIWINRKYSNTNQILSLAEVNDVDQVLVYFDNNQITKITLIEYGHTLNVHEGNLPKKIVEKILSDLYKMFNGNSKIQNVFNRFCKNGFNLANTGLEIYLVSLISELKNNAAFLPTNDVDKLIKYRKVWLSYRNDVEIHTQNNKYYYSNLNNLPLRLENNIRNFLINKNVELRKDDVYLNIILNKITIKNYKFNDLFDTNSDIKTIEKKPYLINAKRNDIEIENVLSNKGNNYQLRMDFSKDEDKVWIDEISKKNNPNTIISDDNKENIIKQILGLEENESAN